ETGATDPGSPSTAIDGPASPNVAADPADLPTTPGDDGTGTAGARTGGYTSAGTSNIPSSDSPSEASSSTPPAAASAPVLTASEARSAFRLRESASVGIGYAVVLLTGVLLFVVASVWRRGSLSL